MRDESTVADGIDGDPELPAKNACVDALFAPETGSDPFLNDSMRSAIEFAITGDGSPSSLESFMRKAMELSHSRRLGQSNFSMVHVNLRSRSYEPLWVRQELLDGLKNMAGHRRSLLVVSGLEEAVCRALPKRGRRKRAPVAMAEARRYIDSLGARFSAGGSRMNIMYLD